MWDPGNYEDTDFGLDDDETFEPEGAEEWDEVDLASPHIRTVLGPIPPDALGICLPFEWLDLPEAPNVNPGSFHLPERDSQIAAELEAYFVSGGRSLVNLAPLASTEGLERLRVIARLVPVHLITASQAGSPGEDASGVAILDLDTAPSGSVSTDPAVPMLLRNACNHSSATLTGLAHQRGEHAAAMTILVEQQAASHEALLELATLGFTIGFSGIGTDQQATNNAIASILHLMEAGFSDRVLVSTGLKEPSQFVSQGGGPGWIYLLEYFTLQLMSAGASAMDIRALLIDNPARALSIVPQPTQ